MLIENLRNVMIKSKKNEDQKIYYDVVKMIDHIIILFLGGKK